MCLIVQGTLDYCLFMFFEEMAEWLGFHVFFV